MSKKQTKTIAAIGEVLWDILPECVRLGGAPFNFTCRVDSLGDTGLMISRLGADALGDEAVENIRLLGIDTSLLQRDPVHPTGTVQVTFDDNKTPDYFIVPDVAYDYIEYSDTIENAVSRADCLCFGTLVQRSDTTRSSLARLLERSDHCLKVLDINLRRECYSRETVEYSLAHADLMKLNDDEARVLCKMLDMACDGPIAFSQQIMQRYAIGNCLITFGRYGALVISRTGQTIYEPGYRINLVDSVGSGDAFTAGFVHKYLRGKSIRESCHFGNVLGAIVATQPGGTEPISVEHVEQFEQDVTERNTLPEFAPFAVL